MKIKQKIFLIILVMIILIGNISYATNITTQQLETSIQNLFSKNITIVTTTSSNDGNATTTRKIVASNVSIANSQMQITDASTGKLFFIDYKIEGDVCKFTSSVDLSQVDDLEIDPTILQVMLPMYQATYLELCYLTVADATGVDFSLADTYYNQKINGQTGNVQCDVFSYAQVTDTNNISNITLEINLTQLKQLNSSKIDETPSCTVTVEGYVPGTTTTPDVPSTDTTPEPTPETPSETPTQQEPTLDTTMPEQPSVDTTPEQKPSTDTTQQENPSNSTKPNQTNTEIPKAGLETDIALTLFALGAMVIFFYRKNKENQDIM